LIHRTSGDFKKAIEKRLGKTISLSNWGKVASRLTGMGYHEPISDNDTDKAARCAARMLKGMSEQSPDELKVDLSNMAGE